MPTREIAAFALLVCYGCTVDNLSSADSLSAAENQPCTDKTRFEQNLTSVTPQKGKEEEVDDVEALLNIKRLCRYSLNEDWFLHTQTEQDERERYRFVTQQLMRDALNTTDAEQIALYLGDRVLSQDDPPTRGPDGSLLWPQPPLWNETLLASELVAWLDHSDPTNLGAPPNFLDDRSLDRNMQRIRALQRALINLSTKADKTLDALKANHHEALANELDKVVLGLASLAAALPAAYLTALSKHYEQPAARLWLYVSARRTHLDMDYDETGAFRRYLASMFFDNIEGHPENEITRVADMNEQSLVEWVYRMGIHKTAVTLYQTADPLYLATLATKVQKGTCGKIRDAVNRIVRGVMESAQHKDALPYRDTFNTSILELTSMCTEMSE